jgi:LPS-assembly lipoprotein
MWWLEQRRPRPDSPPPRGEGLEVGIGQASMTSIVCRPTPSRPHKGAGRTARLALALSLSLFTAGCYQPLYGSAPALGSGGGTGLRDKLSAVDVTPINAPNGTRLARVGVNVRNELIYDLTGGGAAAAPAYRLDVQLSSTNLQVILDINTARPDVQNYGIDATYKLINVATGKPVVTGQTFSRVSYNIPGEEQRFAGERGLRDAEDRAGKVIADNIRSRLASYFVAGT